LIATLKHHHFKGEGQSRLFSYQSVSFLSRN
jgi:hypothetical protein